MKSNEVCTVNTWSERFNLHGTLSLQYVNDTIHVIEYKDQERSIAVDIDHVEVNTPDSAVRFTFPRGSGDRLEFRIEDDAELSVLSRAKEDCHAICEMKLRLNSVLRDAYYSGMYSNLDPDAKIILCDEMEKLKKETPNVFFSSLLNSSEMRRDMSVGAIPKKATKHADDANSVLLNDVVCVFCEAAMLQCKDLEFIVHPNVPMTSSGKNVFMCSVCIENWKEYRDIAEHDDQLVLPGEVNEELCAICSDTPHTLVLCGECPRSFCNNCLARVLTRVEIVELEKNNDADWMCTCCIAGFSKNPPLTRTAWKMVAGRRNYTYGTLVPYTKSHQSATQNTASTSSSSSSSSSSSKPTNILGAGGLGQNKSSSVGVSIGASSFNGNNSGSSSPSNGAAIVQRNLRAHSQAQSKAQQVRDAIEKDDDEDASDEDCAIVFAKPSKPKPVPIAVTTTTSSSSAATANQCQNVNNKGKNKVVVANSAPVSASAAHTPIPISNAKLDEKYYFGQYLSFYKLQCEEIVVHMEALLTAAATTSATAARNAHKRKRNLSSAIATDDVCFLCKDGGELIECDWRCATAKHGERCLKVYHTYCLDFEVPENDKWCCPRHYCDMCGNQTLKFVCKYCPVSLCANCPEQFVAKVSSIDLVELFAATYIHISLKYTTSVKKTFRHFVNC